MSPALPATVLAVVVPTYNERGNVRVIVDAVRHALGDQAWELIFVDDNSPDGTWQEVQRCAEEDGRVRRLRRVGRRGLASACIEGAMASAAPFVAVMDADGQHDAGLLPLLLERAHASGCDVVVAARTDSAGREAFRGPLRRWLTRTGNAVGRALSGGATPDPLSGFFLARREVFERRVGELYGHGFKLLLDLLSASRTPLRVESIPITLQPRIEGASKLNFGVALDYALLVAYRLTGHLVSPRFVLYCAVGFIGLGVHLAVLQGVFTRGDGFLLAQVTATWVAMTSNYFLNNWLTFRDRILRGAALWAGLLHFYVACSLGAVVGVAVGELLYSSGLPVWVAGGGGALASAIWNFTLNNAFTWRER